ncbi:hypothetical protein MMC08_008961 [Hypocenomyce scalaris]|nr:hypothetical protein [Hypocenomyce scalaris]
MAKDLSNNDGSDETRETIDGSRTLQQSFHPGRYPPEFDGVTYEGPTHESFQQTEPRVYRTEAVSLFKNAVETARQAIPQPHDISETVDELKLKLTVDLSHTQLEDIPQEVADILKRDVER